MKLGKYVNCKAVGENDVEKVATNFSKIHLNCDFVKQFSQSSENNLNVFKLFFKGLSRVFYTLPFSLTH